MNYIIFNGKDSRDIKSLIISELPPITKAPVKNELIEIDGVDGDIVIKKGYKSYVRSMFIGLRRNYNIDEVINYFNQTGWITFSNEPDKKYYVDVLDQIDFERLIRFRTATVNFYAKPYKYLINEAKATNTYTETDPKELIVTNQGFENSKPTIYIKGTGKIEVSINGSSCFKYDFNTDTEVYINSEEENAYLKNDLKNRNMIGKFPQLVSGKNKITWTGDIKKIEVDIKSRWL